MVEHTIPAESDRYGTNGLRPMRVALAGNPNCGKTSLFNALTGARQHVANYPGVTVERRSGSCVLNGRKAEIIDLPGTYSLSSYTPEEQVAQDELTSHPDVVVLVADSTQLERNLVLLAQVLQTGANPVLCLNMADEAKAAGQRIDTGQMELLLGFPVVETVGHRAQGLEELRGAILKAAKTPLQRNRLVLGEQLEKAIAAVRPLLPESGAPALSSDWIATRLLVDDAEYTRQVGATSLGKAAVEEAARQRAIIQSDTGLDIQLFVTERYFGFVDGLLREVRTTKISVADARAMSDQIDRVVTHPLLGLPIFGVVMYVVFWLTFTVGEIPMKWIEIGVRTASTALSSFWPDGSESVLRSLLVDGVVAGVGGVVVFLPNILILFMGLAFLEDTGYMARAAFLTDRVMHRFGLHGKSFIPMLTGFGCTVPGVMATRTLENERDRLVTMLVLPLMSCGARLPIWSLLIPAFFVPAWRAPVLWFIYATGIMLALCLALLLRRTVLRGDDAPFVMELPPYRMPTARSVIVKMVERAWLYLRKAGTTILAISIVLWVATSYPKASRYQVDEDMHSGKVDNLPMAEIAIKRANEDLQASVAGRVGRFLEPAFAPIGFDWKIVTGMIGAFAAKEVFVSQMGIVYSIANPDEEVGADGLRAKLARDYSPVVGLSLMLFLLVATPCMATLAVTRRESGRWRWALLQFGGLTVVAYILALLVYQVGRHII